MHVPLALFDPQVVEHLFHSQHAQGGDVEHLRLASLEKTGPMGTFHRPDLDGKRTDLGGRATVQTDPLVNHSLPHRGLEGLLEGLPGLVGQVGIVITDGGHCVIPQLPLHGGPPTPISRPDQLFQPGPGSLFDLLHHLRREVGDRRPLHFRYAHHPDQLQLQVDALPDDFLGLFEAFDHRRLVAGRVSFGRQTHSPGSGPGFHHHHVDLAGVVPPTGHGDLEHRFRDLFVGGERCPLPLDESQPSRPDRSPEGNGAHRKRGRGPDQRQYVERILTVDRQRHGHHLGLASKTFREGGPEGPVDQPASQDGPFAGPTFPPEE